MSEHATAFYTPQQIAEMLQIDRHMVYRLIGDGTLHSVTLGTRTIRIPHPSFVAFLAASKTVADR